MADPPYYAVRRIYRTAFEPSLWEAFHGTLTLAGVDPYPWDVEAFCNAFVIWMKARMQPSPLASEQDQAAAEQAWTSWVTWVEEAPPGWPRASGRLSPTAELAAQYAAARSAAGG